MSPIKTGAIDCDVHVEPPSMDALLGYIDPYWHEFIRSGHLGVRHRLYPESEPMSARPEARGAAGGAAGSFPPHTYEELRAQLLDTCEPLAVILTCVATFQGSRNPYFEAAMTTAVNNWMRDEFLDRDPRLRGSIVVPVFHPEGAAEEIDRLGGDRRFAQVLLPVRSETPWGNVRYRAIHEAASRNRLPITLHAWGGWGMAPTSTGTAATYYEDYLYNSQIVAPNQVLSLVAEGVFDRYPDLRVCLAELGFAWLPSLLWRFDKDWKALWRETPWVRDKPSVYVRKHLRATTSPTLIPGRTAASELAQLADMLDAGHMLLYSSDYPHDHGNDALETLLDVIGEENREAVLSKNAAAFFDIPVPAAS
jgi:predicted TIM-barrel fold metal-dependent hydrolase